MMGASRLPDDLKYARYDGDPCVLDYATRRAWVRFAAGWTELNWAEVYTKAGLLRQDEYARHYPHAGLPDPDNCRRSASL